MLRPDEFSSTIMNDNELCQLAIRRASPIGVRLEFELSEWPVKPGHFLTLCSDWQMAGHLSGKSKVLRPVQLKTSSKTVLDLRLPGAWQDIRFSSQRSGSLVPLRKGEKVLASMAETFWVGSLTPAIPSLKATEGCDLILGVHLLVRLLFRTW